MTEQRCAGEALACFVGGALVQVFREPGDGYQRIWTRDATGIQYIPSGSPLAACCYRDIVAVFELAEMNGILWARRWPPFGMMPSSYCPADTCALRTRRPHLRPSRLAPCTHSFRPRGSLATMHAPRKQKVWFTIKCKWRGNGRRVAGASNRCRTRVFRRTCLQLGVCGAVLYRRALGQSWQVGQYEGVLYAARRSM